jgi:hypothetical protein
MKDAEKIEDLSRDELMELTRIYAKNWLAHDGCWFLAAEQKYGMDAAIELDTQSWQKSSKPIGSSSSCGWERTPGSRGWKRHCVSACMPR